MCWAWHPGVGRTLFVDTDLAWTSLGSQAPGKLSGVSQLNEKNPYWYRSKDPTLVLYSGFRGGEWHRP